MGDTISIASETSDIVATLSTTINGSEVTLEATALGSEGITIKDAGGNTVALDGVTITLEDTNADSQVSTGDTFKWTIESETVSGTAVASTATLSYTFAYADGTVTVTNGVTGASDTQTLTLGSASYITASSDDPENAAGDKLYIDDTWEQDGTTYTQTYGTEGGDAITYTYTEGSNSASYTRTYAPAEYTFTQSESDEFTVYGEDGSEIAAGTYSGTYTTTADGAEISFEGLTKDELVAAITAAIIEFTGNSNFRILSVEAERDATIGHRAGRPPG